MKPNVAVAIPEFAPPVRTTIIKENDNGTA
jgi:hypothetical protein